MTRPTVVPSGAAFAGMRRGFDELAHLLALTLGPERGVVLHADGRGAPELLRDSGTIARRVTQLPGGAADAGAMLLREMVWGVRERYGDGAATAGVLARAMAAAAARSIAAGADPMLLRRGIERGVEAAAAALEAQAAPVAGQAPLAALAASVTSDDELAAILGEIFATLGPDGALQVEEFSAPHLDRAYLDGGRWRARPAARALMPEGPPELTLRDALLLVADEALTRLEQVRPALELAAQDPARPPLLIVARELGGPALEALTLNHARGTLTVAAAIMTSAGGVVADDLDDLALLTGAALHASVAGRAPERLGAAGLGRARQITLTNEYLTVTGGAGEREAARRRAGELRTRIERAGTATAEGERLRMRVARLSGGVGVLRIGAFTERERDLRKATAQQTARVLEAALREGVVPGGGVAYLDAAPAARMAARELAGDLGRGAAIVAEALEAPFRQIVANSGAEPAPALDELRRLGPGYGFDARTGRLAPLTEFGALDCLSVARGALRAAASAATMLITTDVLVMR